MLFVDDEARILSALQRSLRREGYRILTAQTPAAALHLIDEEPVDVIVSDQKMPGMSGLALLAEVVRRRPSVRRLLITGWPEEIPPEQVEALGIRAVLPKPWDERELKAILRKETATDPQP
ncbi:MAG: response regulator [Deltaproteobacteria bacterium]|nr:response regulator [Deltaproteobacteria bacterium]